MSERREWIAVKAALPPAVFGAAENDNAPFLSEDVVVLFRGGGLWIANYDHESTIWTEAKDSAKEFDCDPDYWLSLPAFPIALLP